ncbi:MULTISPECIES: EthD domain-containing protein [Paenibacillus]|uniref:EthD domain-containing protein n=1 Tax=Paenibacillus peoriae TaxID=59893 RepID=A0A7H0Y782_9BACL|nr:MULTISPECIES: EthD domain-containing protein [Paenibacillus]KOS00960.1 hypothetical protein AM598_20125 [Paenibacillus polymyxa]QNR66940.1 EthD domain-containing protein [Paenibacillus peoriae]
MKDVIVYPENGHSIVAVIRRKPGMTLEEFHHHYKFVHAPLSAQLPRLVSYRQPPTRTPGQGDGPYMPTHLSFDAVSIYIFENTAAAEAAWTSPEGLLLDEDAVKFIDLDTQIILPVTPRQVV